jgi:hypothetical protein
MATTPYRHEPLDESTKEIRLLVLDPYDEDRETEIASQPLKCCITRRSLASSDGMYAKLDAKLDADLFVDLDTDLDADPFVDLDTDLDADPFADLDTVLDADVIAGLEYHAISYSWGTVEGTVPICVSGRLLEVPKSTENVLRSLHRCSGGISAPIWIDSICIDQANVQEKGKQVAMMDLIFKHAAMVHVWLGPSDDSVAAAISSIRTITYEQDYKSAKNFSSKVGTRKLRWFTGVPLPTRYDWPALLSFFSSGWFTRLWVVQEAVLARKAICHCGSLNIPLENVISAAHWMESNRRGLQHMLKEEDAGRRGMYNAAQMYALKHGLKHRQLVDLLKLCPRFQATDLRDKVFGLLGMSDKWRTSRHDAKLDPDYTESNTTEVVYRSATRAALEEAGSLRLLQDAQALVHSEETPNNKVDRQLPSWVPRFHFVRDPDRGALANIKCQNACDGEWLHMEHSPEDVLRLEGMVCDEVAEVTEAMSVSLFDNQAAFRDHLGKLWDIAKAEVSGPAPDLSTAFRRVLLGGSDPNKRSGPPNFLRPSTTGETGEQLKSTIGALLMTTISPQFDIEERYQWRIKDHESLSDRQWRSYLEELMNMSVNRVFFITEGGRMGLGPANTQKGDTVCILCGGQVPFVLRKEEMHWQLIGDAYLDGVMNVSFRSRKTTLEGY